MTSVDVVLSDFPDLFSPSTPPATAAALRAACEDVDSRGTVDASATTLSWSEGDVSVSVQQGGSFGDTASHVWVDSLALAHYLGTLSLSRGALGRTLDLSAGTGSLGCWVAKAGLSTGVGLADRRSQLPLLRANAKLNDCTVEAHGLEYGDAKAALALRGVN